MKIAYDYKIFFTQRYGGISRYFVMLAKELSAKGEDVKIFAPIHRNHYLENSAKSLVSGHKIPNFLRKAGLPYAFANRKISNAQITNWQPDIVHQTYYNWPKKITPAFPTVITVYDMIHELFPDTFKAKDNTADIKKAAIKNADHVICISECTKKDLLQFLDISESDSKLIS